MNMDNRNNNKYDNINSISDIKQCTTALERVTLSAEEYHTIQTCQQSALHNTTWSSEENVLFCSSLDEEVQSFMVNGVDKDELPPFQIRLLSPYGQSPSPINIEESVTSCLTPKSTDFIKNISLSTACHNKTDFVTLEDINTQICLPNDHNLENTESVSTTVNNLETIYEGVFLHTPPRQLQRSVQYQQRLHRKCNSGFLEKITTNIIIERGKENVSPKTLNDEQY